MKRLILLAALSVVAASSSGCNCLNWCLGRQQVVADPCCDPCATTTLSPGCAPCAPCDACAPGGTVIGSPSLGTPPSTFLPAPQ